MPSQFNEDREIEKIFERFGTTDKYAVEFGVESGFECNTEKLQREGWTVLQMDGTEYKVNTGDIKIHFITKENIVMLFERYNVPKEFDFLSVDIDGNDYYVTDEILRAGYRPRVICSEINPHLGSSDAITIPYDPHFVWSKENDITWFGMSFAASIQLMNKWGYQLVNVEDMANNAFFVRNDLLFKKHRHFYEKSKSPWVETAWLG